MEVSGQFHAPATLPHGETASEGLDGSERRSGHRTTEKHVRDVIRPPDYVSLM